MRQAPNAIRRHSIYIERSKPRSQHRLLFLHHGSRHVRGDARGRHLPRRLRGPGRPQILQELLPLLPDQPGHQERRGRSGAEGMGPLQPVQSELRAREGGREGLRIHRSFDPQRGRKMTNPRGRTTRRTLSHLTFRSCNCSCRK